MLAILEDALAVLQQHHTATSQEHKQLFEEVKLWSSAPQ